MPVAVILLLLFAVPILMAWASDVFARYSASAPKPGPMRFRIFGLSTGLCMFYIVEAVCVMGSGFIAAVSTKMAIAVIEFPDVIYFYPALVGGVLSGIVALWTNPKQRQLVAAKKEMKE